MVQVLEILMDRRIFATRYASKKPISLSIIFTAHFHRSNVMQFNSNSFSLSLCLSSLVLRTYVEPPTIDERARSINIFNGLLAARERQTNRGHGSSIEAKEDGAPTLHYRYIDKRITCRDDGAPEPVDSQKQ